MAQLLLAQCKFQSHRAKAWPFLELSPPRAAELPAPRAPPGPERKAGTALPATYIRGGSVRLGRLRAHGKSAVQQSDFLLLHSEAGEAEAEASAHLHPVGQTTRLHPDTDTNQLRLVPERRLCGASVITQTWNQRFCAHRGHGLSRRGFSP